VVLLAASILLLSLFEFRLSGIPSRNYEARDDAIITLSQARNLVEYGFIGVSPSGERLEASSAPLQFWIAAGTYALVPFDYRTFLHWQVSIGMLLVGALLAGLFLGGLDRAHGGVWRIAFIAVAIPVCAYLVTDSRTFLLWHASGMENPYRTVLLIALLWCLERMLHTGRLHAPAVVLAFAASISRIDAVVPVFLVLAVFSGLWWHRHRDARGLRFALAGLALWTVYNAWRWYYFGQWQPNTALAQGIDVSKRLADIWHRPIEMAGDWLRWSGRVGIRLNAFPLLVCPVLLFLLRRHRTAVERALLLSAGAIGCLAQYVLFGTARMDEARTVTELAAYGAALIPWVWLGRGDFGWKHAAIGVTLLASSVVIASYRPADIGAVAWSATWFEQNADAIEVASRQFGIPRPTLANADLGAVSWRKRFNMIDIGGLGSAVVPRASRPDLYLAEFAKPDFIEIHDGWSCHAAALFSNPPFLADYEPIRSERTPWLAENCAGQPAVRSGIWVRRAVKTGSGSTERRFLEAFEKNFDVAVARDELARCLGRPEPRPCAYLGRTLFRFVPELKRAGRYAAVVELLAHHPALRFEHALVTSSTDPAWWKALPIPSYSQVSVAPDRISAFARIADGARPVQKVDLRAVRDARWRLTVARPDLLEVVPLEGVGPAAISVAARPLTGDVDANVEVRVYRDGERDASASLKVRVRSVRAGAPAAPFGFVDTPADPVVLGRDPLLFQGWALDHLCVRRVWVECRDRSGAVTTLGDAVRDGMRPDVAAAYPDASDVFHSAWALTVPADLLRRRPLPVVLHFYAENADGRRAEIGARRIIGK
jgi:hypothetical protein